MPRRRTRRRLPAPPSWPDNAPRATPKPPRGAARGSSPAWLSTRVLPLALLAVFLVAAAGCTTGGAGNAGAGNAGAGDPAAGFLGCAPLAKLEKILQPGTVVLFGENHGTRQVPEFFADVICGALEAGHRVAVGLEMPVTLNEPLDTYLRSDGGEEDVDALLASSRFWTRDYQDGRASRAILDLVEQLRRWSAAGLPLDVFAFDGARSFPDPQAREEGMARHLNAAIRDAGEDSLVFALTGNLHARMAGGAPWDRRFRTMGELAEEDLPGRRWIALDATSHGGTAWSCTEEAAESCGSRRVRGTDPRPRGLNVGPRGKGVAYNGTFHVGAVTSSPPAVAGAGEE